ncbi:hypothetical protein [Actinomyces slackii]|uniref:hypothetical protein n=1 Tax=Actinomyces slackii TaxID=52774 RepID=UPI000F81F779|nr:hypothetical protein [Actinomyces slackii]
MPWASTAGACSPAALMGVERLAAGGPLSWAWPPSSVATAVALLLGAAPSGRGAWPSWGVEAWAPGSPVADAS